MPPAAILRLPQQPSARSIYNHPLSVAWIAIRLAFIVLKSIMRPVTRIIADEIPLLKHPPADTEAVVPSPPELKAKCSEATPSAARLAKRNALLSPAESSRKIIRGQPRALALPKIKESGNSSDPVVRDESPWDTFEKFYECDLAGTVTVCVRRSGRSAVWAVRQYPSKDADRILQILSCARHKNVVSVLECFRTSDVLYTIGKHHPLTLDHLVACKAFPDQKQLAAIMSQVLPPVPRGYRRPLTIPSFLMDYHILLPKISITRPWVVPVL